jgi:hypothetical protein
VKIRGCVIVGLMCGLISFAAATRAGDINVKSTANWGCTAGASTNNVVGNAVAVVSVTDQVCGGIGGAIGGIDYIYVYSLSFLASSSSGEALGQIGISGPNVIRFGSQKPFGLVLDETVGLTPQEVSGLNQQNIFSSWFSDMLILSAANFKAGDELTFYLTSAGPFQETGTLSVGTDGGYLSAPVFVPTPEPTTFLLFGTSLLGLAPFGRKLFGR